MTFTHLTLGEPRLKGIPRGETPFTPCIDTVVESPVIRTMSQQLLAVGGGPDGDLIPVSSVPPFSFTDIEDWFWRDPTTQSASTPPYGPVDNDVAEGYFYCQRYLSSESIQWRTTSTYGTVILPGPVPNPPFNNATRSSHQLIPITTWSCVAPLYRHTAAVEPGVFVDVTVNVSNSHLASTINYLRIDFYDDTNTWMAGPLVQSEWARSIGTGLASPSTTVFAPSGSRWMRAALQCAVNQGVAQGTPTTNSVSSWEISTT